MDPVSYITFNSREIGQLILEEEQNMATIFYTLCSFRV
jgi:hypothetical protein